MFQQTQVVYHQNCQIFRRNVNTDEINDEGLFASILESLQISQHDYENLSQQFKSETMVDFRQFLEIFYGIIKQQKDLEGENQQYIYMKQNLIRLLIESLRLCLQKGGQINFETSFDNFLRDDSQQFLSEEAQLRLFQNSTICEKLRDYIFNQFDNNKPEGNYDSNFFKQCWEDYSHYKQRSIDKIAWQRQDITKFNKIYRWDTLYTKIIELILYSNQLSALNIHNRQNFQKSSFILQHGLLDIKDQIQQNQEQHSQLIKQIEFHQQKLSELELKYNELKQEKQNKQMQQSDESDKKKLTQDILGNDDSALFQQSQQFSNIIQREENENYNQLIQQSQEDSQRSYSQVQLIQEELQTDQYEREQQQKLSDNKILLKKYLKPDKLHVTISQIPEKKRLKKAAQILGELMYKDLKYQILQGDELDIDLENFYNTIDNGMQNQKDFACNEQSFKLLNQTKRGKNYFTNFLNHQLKEMLDTSKKEFELINQEMKKLQKTLNAKNGKERFQQQEEYDY